MLILTRRLDEVVVLEVNGVACEIHVKGIASNRVQLGFDAPECVTIVRKELLERPRRERRRA